MENPSDFPQYLLAPSRGFRDSCRIASGLLALLLVLSPAVGSAAFDSSWSHGSSFRRFQALWSDFLQSPEGKELEKLVVDKSFLQALFLLDSAQRTESRPRAPSRSGATRRTLLSQLLFFKNDLARTLGRGSKLELQGLFQQELLRTYASVLVASKAFSVDSELLFCLLFQESRLYPGAMSATGAEGLAQLTRAGRLQIETLLENSSIARKQMENFQRDLEALYENRAWRWHLQALLPELRFPVGGSIQGISRSPITEEFLDKVQLLLSHEAPELLQDRSVLAQVCSKIRRGRRVAEKWDPLVRAYHVIRIQEYGSRLGFTFNPESSVASAALLLRYYQMYPWRLQGEQVVLSSQLRNLLAVAAYNQGPTGVGKLLESFAEEGILELEPQSPELFLEIVTQEVVQLALANGRSAERYSELHTHIQKVLRCSWNLAPQESTSYFGSALREPPLQLSKP